MNWHVIIPSTSMAIVGISIKRIPIQCNLLKLDNAPCWQPVVLKLVVNCGADGTVYSDKLQNF
jgi:hypothetical protein